ncbi:MAG: hypothetical protein HRT74_08270 [Flavobacteriales bacterium]|nr:hypothetical protein [Flavobacteriales bacterium]
MVGRQDGVSFWQGTEPTCSITGAIAGPQANCNNLTNEYEQTLFITYDVPPLTGTINVNGEEFAVTGSPLEVIITAIADGSSQDVTVFFTDETSCTATFNGAFVALGSCFCPTDLNSDGVTDIQDLLIFLGDFGCMENCVADINGNGSTGGDDLLAILSAFGNPCV